MTRFPTYFLLRVFPVHWTGSGYQLFTVSVLNLDPLDPMILLKTRVCGRSRMEIVLQIDWWPKRRREQIEGVFCQSKSFHIWDRINRNLQIKNGVLEADLYVCDLQMTYLLTQSFSSITYFVCKDFDTRNFSIYPWVEDSQRYEEINVQWIII